MLIGILASANLTECHGMAISGYPMSRLDVIGKGHGHLLLYKRDRDGPLIVSLQVFASPTGAAMK